MTSRAHADEELRHVFAKRKRDDPPRRRFELAPDEDRRPKSGRFESVDKPEPECVGRKIDQKEADALVQKWLAQVTERRTESGPAFDPVDDEDDPDVLAQHLIDAMEKVVIEKEQMKDIHSRRDLSTDLLRDIRRSQGDLRLDAIRTTLNQLGYTRSKYQKIFHDAFVQSCLPM